MVPNSKQGHIFAKPKHDLNVRSLSSPRQGHVLDQVPNLAQTWFTQSKPKVLQNSCLNQ
ncbi:hypothetical protein PIB30_068227, partial [Stylosanthes scabra]|nr:hypothetical protein [Stylosanthes scabra]